MTISPFFLDLRSAYQSELDDLTFDSEGRDVLKQRLLEKRKELDFLLKMLEISPEMVAVVFHKAFQFRIPAVLDHLLCQESDELPTWDALTEAVDLAPWAQDLARMILAEPMGEWFMAIAVGLEYMYSRPGVVQRASESDDEDEDKDKESHEQDADEESVDERDDDEEDARSREEAGADWLAEQGFDRKE